MKLTQEVPYSGPALVIGATGYIGRFVADACLDSGHKTYILVRPSGASPARAAAVEALREKGAIIIEGSVNGKHGKDFIEAALREHGIEVVISVLGGANIRDQLGLIEAIKAAGTVKRFLPSEFGHDIDKASPVEPGLSFYEEKRKVRRAAEAAGVPYTYICCNSIASWPYFNNTHPSEVPPPLDRFQIYGDGTVRAFFVAGSDIGKFTIKAAYDARSLNKIVHFRPACNLLNMNEMASLWESKIGRMLPRITLSEKDLLTMAADANISSSYYIDKRIYTQNIIPASIVAALTHDIFINGCQTSFHIDGCRDIEISSLYPDMIFRTIDECFDVYVAGLDLKEEVKESTNAPMVERLAVPPTCA